MSVHLRAFYGPSAPQKKSIKFPGGIFGFRKKKKKKKNVMQILRHIINNNFLLSKHADGTCVLVVLLFKVHGILGYGK